MRGFSDTTAPYSFAFESYGIPIEVRASSEEILERIEALIPPTTGRIPSSPENKRFGIVEEVGGEYTVYNPKTLVCTHVGLPLAIVTIEGQLRSWVAIWAPDAIFVHAGVVGYDGGAIAIPGESFTGKTTLIAELVRRGATYFSDEFAVVDREGLVHPFVKPLSMRKRDSGPVETPAESLGAIVADGPLPLKLACVAHYVPGA